MHLSFYFRHFGLKWKRRNYIALHRNRAAILAHVGTFSFVKSQVYHHSLHCSACIHYYHQHVLLKHYLLTPSFIRKTMNA